MGCTAIVHRFNMIISILFDVYATVSEEVNAGEIIPMAQQLQCLLRNSAVVRRSCRWALPQAKR